MLCSDRTTPDIIFLRRMLHRPALCRSDHGDCCLGQKGPQPLSWLWSSLTFFNKEGYRPRHALVAIFLIKKCIAPSNRLLEKFRPIMLHENSRYCNGETERECAFEKYCLAFLRGEMMFRFGERVNNFHKRTRPLFSRVPRNQPRK